MTTDNQSSPPTRGKVQAKLEEWFGRYFGNIIFTNLVGISFFVTIVYLCWNLAPTFEAKLINVLVALIGGALGWAAGMYFAPHGEVEQSKFVSIGQAVSAFVSGYALSKFDRFLEASIFSSGGIVDTGWVRLGLFFCTFLVSVMVVYSNRSYFLVR